MTSVWVIAGIHTPFGDAAVKESWNSIRNWLRDRTSKVNGKIIIGDTNSSQEKLHKLFPKAHIQGHRIDCAITWNCRIKSVTPLPKHGSDHQPVLFHFVNDQGSLSGLTWNVWEGHRPAEVRAALAAMMKAHKPDFIVLQEAIRDYGHLHGLGYQVVQLKPHVKNKGAKSNTANIAILVKNGIKIKGRYTISLKRLWRGPKHGLKQDPRTYRWVRLHKK